MKTDRLTAPWWGASRGAGSDRIARRSDKFFNLLADWPGYLRPDRGAATAVQPVRVHAYRRRHRDGVGITI
jgi:hypothetical protein